MDVACAYSALSTALTYGTQLGFLVFLKALIELIRPDIVDTKNRVAPVSVQTLHESYDFIIIGAGSAGSVVANRLTENANWTVLLLEAGGDETALSDVPSMYRFVQRTELDWEFKTAPSEDYCLGFSNNQCVWPRGKALGGTSTINMMMYVRGNPNDYDSWAEAGNVGWSYEDVLPYFKKSENMSIKNLHNSEYHGTGGYLSVESFRNRTAVSGYILDAGRDLGYDLIDVNGKSQQGFMASHGTLKDGLRCSTAKAFLRPASHRPNLYVSTNSLAEKILVDETTKTAYGVQFNRGGRTYKIHANKEVILSAGTVQSPQVLMLSGIGPQEHLEEVGIDVIHDSPGVGQNLQDHVAMGGLVFLVDIPAPSGVSLPAVQEFLNQKKGPLYAIPPVESMAFVSTKYAEPTTPDIELVFASGGDNLGRGFSAKYYRGMKDEFYESLYGDIPTNVTYTIAPSVMRPKSKGYIKLRDADPNHHPIIVPNYFADPEDLDVLIEGAKIVYKLSQTKTMKKFNARPNHNKVPECADYELYSDEYLRCYARYYTQTAYHPTSTCKMGPAEDNMAVVDSRLRVYGVDGLRVIDASVMPNIISGNTNAPTIMIAEKAADLIKEEYTAVIDVTLDPNTK